MALYKQRVAVLASVVSSRMLRAIAIAEGVEYYDTLTGTDLMCTYSYLHHSNFSIRLLTS